MKKKILFISIIASLLLAAFAPMPQTIGEELIKNGTFDDGLNNWGIYKEGGTGEMAVTDGVLVTDVQNAGSKEWAVQPYQDGVLLIENNKYLISVDLWSTVQRDVKVRIQQNGGTYTGYLEEQVTITPTPTTYTFEFVMYYASDPAGRLVLNFGQFAADETLPSHQVYMDNVSLVLQEGENEYVSELENLPSIRINQVGYLPEEQKIAMFADLDPSITTFDLIDYQGNIVLTGDITGETYNEASEETIRYGDFSSITKAGSYRIQVGKEKSGAFRISGGAYTELSDALFKLFAYQRSGQDLDWMLFGDFAHPAGYTAPARLYDTDTYIDVTGGWMDAGDYGRYISPGSKAVIDLMLAYQRAPQAYTDDTQIPESGNGIPDILDEIKIELDFFLKMQDLDTGGVYHKATTANFVGNIWPQENTEEVIVTPISAQATADFAAIMAKASVVYQSIDPAAATEYLQRAQQAWAWLIANPNAQEVNNPEGIQTGAYDDINSMDERTWAAAELYAATGEAQYHDYLKNNDIYTGFGWQSMGNYAMVAYLNLSEEKQDATLRQAYQTILLQQVEEIAYQSSQDAYHSSLTFYDWGSNMDLTNNALVLLFAHQFFGEDYMRDIALQHLHYLLGQNAVATSFVTEFGYRSASHPHHRISQLVGSPVPGMLVGGPDEELEDPYAVTMLTGFPPQKAYIDSDQSYSTNEITIYWNSAMLYLVDYFTK